MPSSSLADCFNDPATWRVIPSGLAVGTLTSVKTPDGKIGLQLDYDFRGGAGFIVARKEIEFNLTEIFDLILSIRGEGPQNHFEFKLIDPSGSNAWRYLREYFQMPADWTQLKIHERDLPFAWGPAGGGAPSVVGAIELVIVAGPGGKGSVSFSNISLEDPTLHLTRSAAASSQIPNHPPNAVLGSSPSGGWQAAPNDPAPWWSVDFGGILRFGGLVIDWPSSVASRAYDLEQSADGTAWTTLHRATHASGSRSHIPTPGAEARFLRFKFASNECAGIRSITMRPDAFSSTPDEFIHSVATDFPRSWFPRYWHREQSYWTPIGSPEGTRRGLLNEEGMVEVDEAGFSLEPFILTKSAMISWADAKITRHLPADGAPFPFITWETDHAALTIQPWVDGTGNSLALRVNYRIENRTPDALRLAVAVRPFQVNPPWQKFGKLGGISPIHSITCTADEMRVDQRYVSSNHPADAWGAAAFEENGVMGFIALGQMPPRDRITDPAGLASAVMAWSVPPSSDVFEVTLTVPFFDDAEKPSPNSLANAAAHWQATLALPDWRVPAIARDAIASFRSAASHILINRDGPAIQPGPRRYTRSWIRDSVIMGAAMAKAGQPHVLRDFLTWYTEFQRDDGFVPCVVDRTGVDWLVEHDSHGQFLWGICENLRNDGDIDFASSLWKSVRSAATYLNHLRAQRMTPSYREPARSACYGLLPESASHEGYLAHPVHSYWDDFWGVRGLEAAAELADALDHQEDAQLWRTNAQDFLQDVLKSIRHVIADRKLNYIPGSMEWADFDPTATANAIGQLDFADDLPAEPLYQMLDTYLTNFRRKHRDEIPWFKYTAYEIRIIGAFVRVGMRDEAHELLDFFLSDRRPIEWNQWPEISWRDPHAPGHLGDVPHTWIAAEYMLALTSMVASEREASGEMVLASGLPWAWIAEENGFAVTGLLTRYGPLDFAIHAPDSNQISIAISERISLPHGGLSVAPPMPTGVQILTANADDGKPLGISIGGKSITIKSLPVTATLSLGLSTP